MQMEKKSVFFSSFGVWIYFAKILKSFLGLGGFGGCLRTWEGIASYINGGARKSVVSWCLSAVTIVAKTLLIDLKIVHG